MTEIEKWLCEGSRATLAGVAHEDLLRSIFLQRVERGAVSFLLEVKAHCGEPPDEEADDCANNARLG